MISLPAIDCAPSAPSLTALDERVMRVLDVADEFVTRRNADGKCVVWCRLRKPFDGLPAGMRVKLEDLHARLFA